MNIKTRILIAVFLLELLGYGILLFYTYKTNKTNLENVREHQIQATIAGNANRINHLTNLMEHKAIELAKSGELLYQLRDKTPLEHIEPALQSFLISSFTFFPESIGGGLWYEPNVFDKQKTYYGPYVFWNKNKRVEFTWDLSTPAYNYHSQSWYLEALPAHWDRKQARPSNIYWTAPYWDEAGSKALMMTVDAFMKDTKGNIIGLATIDWSLQEMTQFVQGISITKNSKTFLIDTRSDLILSNSLYPASIMSKRESVHWLKNLDINFSQSQSIKVSSHLFIDSTFYRIYYLKSNAGLLLGVAIPEEELNQEIEHATKQAVVNGAIIITLFIISMLILLDVLFRPFQKVKELISNSIKLTDRNTLDIKPVYYPAKNEFTSVIDAINLTYNQINQYTADIEQANKAKTTFLTTMSHEIRTPMNAILGYTQLLGLEKNFPQDHLETIQAIELSGNHLLELLNDVLDIAKIESGAMQLYNENVFIFDVLDNINRTFKIRCKQSNLDWQCDLAIPATYSAYTDKAKISQILINLLSNSIKFTQSGYIELACTMVSNNLHIVIADTGAGITQEQQEKLFTPFFQGHAGQQYGGTGLGLTIVQKLVSLFGGTINLTSEKNKGTRFEVVLPMTPAKLELPPAKHNNSIDMQDFSNHQLTALIVDDVKINCDILAKVLSKLGVKSFKAANGIEALAIINSHKLNALFIDIQMPVMDGLELLQHIKRYHPELLPNTIAISANVYHLDDDYAGAGFQYYISKPFLLGEISATIETIVDATKNATQRHET